MHLETFEVCLSIKITHHKLLSMEEHVTSSTPQIKSSGLSLSNESLVTFLESNFKCINNKCINKDMISSIRNQRRFSDMILFFLGKLRALILASSSLLIWTIIT